MVKNHIKTIAAPKSWPVKRKEKKYILKPSSGPHSLDYSLSLNFILVDMLKIAKTKKEAVYILRNKEVIVDGKRRKDKSFPVGLFDTISINDLKKNYRVVMDKKGKLRLIEIDAKEAAIKPYKIIGKTSIRKKTQLNLFDGSNLLVEKDEFKVGDTILLDTSKKISQHIKLSKGNTVFLIAGRHIGETGIIEDIESSKIIYKENDEVIETSKEYAFVIGEKKPVIKLE